MGGFPSYVPENILEKFGDDPEMKEHLYHYHMIRKHGGGCVNAELVNLFSTIQFQQKAIARMEKEMKDREEYTTSLEARLAFQEQKESK